MRWSLLFLLIINIALIIATIRNLISKKNLTPFENKFLLFISSGLTLYCIYEIFLWG